LNPRALLAAVVVAASLTSARALPGSPQEPPPQELPASEPPASPAEEREGSSLFPRFNFYLPEGRADIRLLKPIRNSLFEMQVAYNFV